MSSVELMSELVKSPSVSVLLVVLLLPVAVAVAESEMSVEASVTPLIQCHMSHVAQITT